MSDRRVSYSASMIRSALAYMCVVLACGTLPARAADVAVSIQLDSSWVELIRAQRRAEGLDLPDAAADAQVRLLLRQLEYKRSVVSSASRRYKHDVARGSRRPFWVTVY